MAPIKSVINGLEKPVKVVESVFGEVIKITEEIIQSIEEMIEEMRNLFDNAGVDALFLNPFTNAAFTALSSIEKLYQLISSVGTPIIDDAESLVMEAANSVYASLRNDMNTVMSTLDDIKTRINEDLEKTGHGIQEDFMRLKTLVESLPVEISILGRKIRQELRVIGEDAFTVPLVVSEEVRRAEGFASASVKKAGTVVGADFASFEASLHRRLSNENAMVDLLCMVIVVVVIAAIVGIFLLTHSMRLVVFIFVIIFISFLLHLLLDIIL
jgi:archaellum component FlaC